MVLEIVGMMDQVVSIPRLIIWLRSTLWRTTWSIIPTISNTIITHIATGTAPAGIHRPGTTNVTAGWTALLDAVVTTANGRAVVIILRLAPGLVVGGVGRSVVAPRGLRLRLQQRPTRW